MAKRLNKNWLNVKWKLATAVNDYNQALRTGLFQWLLTCYLPPEGLETQRKQPWCCLSMLYCTLSLVSVVSLLLLCHPGRPILSRRLSRPCLLRGPWPKGLVVQADYDWQCWSVRNNKPSSPWVLWMAVTVCLCVYMPTCLSFSFCQ